MRFSCWVFPSFPRWHLYSLACFPSVKHNEIQTAVSGTAWVSLGLVMYCQAAFRYRVFAFDGVWVCKVEDLTRVRGYITQNIVACACVPTNANQSWNRMVSIRHQCSRYRIRWVAVLLALLARCTSPLSRGRTASSAPQCKASCGSGFSIGPSKTARRCW
jgi:hypothetical protein